MCVGWYFCIHCWGQKSFRKTRFASIQFEVQSIMVSYVSTIIVGELCQQELHQLEHRQLDPFPGSQEAERDDYWDQLTLFFVCSSRPHPGSGAVFRVGSSHPS